MADTVAGLAPASSEVFARQESRMRTLARRCLTIPAFLVAAGAYLLVLPLLLLVSFAVDLVFRRRLASVRAFTMVGVYLCCESAGIFASAWIWFRRRNREQFLEANFRLQCWWAATLYRAGVRLFSLKVEIEGAESAVAGPMLVFARHVSPIDNLLPAVLISQPNGVRLRWVINRSLLRDPCLDIVGHRLPNCFVANSSGDSQAEIRRVDALGRNLGARDGVLIFPEGGLYSPAKRERVLARLEAAGDTALLEQARRLENLLPPRLGGSLALLNAAQGVDAVFLAHTGLEDSTRYQSILHGGLIGRRIRVRFWRVPASEIPGTSEGRVAWLFDHWQRLDEWIAANQREHRKETADA